MATASPWCFFVVVAQVAESPCALCGGGDTVSPNVLALFPLTGLQPVLLQEGLPPLRSGEYQCFPSGNPAGCGEEKGHLQETFQPSLTGRHTASCAWLYWLGQGSAWELCSWRSLNCGVPAALGTEEPAKTEDRQQEWIQLQLQGWPLVGVRSEGEEASFSGQLVDTSCSCTCGDTSLLSRTSK